MQKLMVVNLDLLNRFYRRPNPPDLPLNELPEILALVLTGCISQQLWFCTVPCPSLAIL